ncbi:MAG: hypothetical protein ACYC5N_04970 [Endomicrobiales bacterium]
MKRGAWVVSIFAGALAGFFLAELLLRNLFPDAQRPFPAPGAPFFVKALSEDGREVLVSRLDHGAGP